MGGALSRFWLPLRAARNAVRLQSNNPGKAGKTKIKNPVHKPGKAKADRKDKQMATYHLSLKNGKTAQGKAHAEYIMRQGKYASGKRAEELVCTNQNLPRWAESAVDFFDKSDIYERSNARSYREFELALPNELSHEQNKQLVEDFIAKHIGNNKVWAYAIHEKAAAFDPGQNQIHAHIMFSDRIVTDGMDKCKPASKFFKRPNAKNPEKGGYAKDRTLSASKAEVSMTIKNIRQSWEEMMNEAYQKKGIDKKVSCKTISAQRADAIEQGDEALAELLDREPQTHLGPVLTYKTKKEITKSEKENKSNDQILEGIKEISDKAYLVVLKKIEKAYKYETYKRNQAIEAQRKAVEHLKEKEEYNQYISGYELRNNFRQIFVGLNIQMELNQAKIKECEQKLLTPEQMSIKAQNILTNGCIREFRKIKRQVDKEEAELQERINRFKTWPKPNNTNPNYRKQYNDESEYLSYTFDNLKKRRELLNTEKVAIDAYIHQPDKFKQYQDIFIKLDSQNNERIKQRKELLEIKAEYEKLQEKVIKSYRAIKAEEYYQINASRYEYAKGRLGDCSTPDVMGHNLDSLIAALKPQDLQPKVRYNNMRLDLSERRDYNKSNDDCMSF